MLSIIIPARNEAENLQDIFDYFNLELAKMDYEVLLINDFSEDNTFENAKNFFKNKNNFKVYNNTKKGLGGAINLGIEKSNGNIISIMMADLSDSLEDLIKYKNIINNENVDAVFGSRFLRESKVKNYPLQKLILNRLFNSFVSFVFWNKYNDYTNAFKIYKKEILEEIMPLVSESFNIFLEIPLKIVARNYKYKVIPISWTGRKKGKTKFKIKELSSKYLFTLIYCFIEKNLLNLKK
jgi:dolichol-phosphate mannosyltransferase